MIVEIKLTKGKVAIVDECDRDLVQHHSWYAKCDNGIWYASTRVAAGMISMHRLLTDSPELEVDHIDGDGLNNRRNNLRVCTHADNIRNQRKHQRKGGCSSRFKGVCWDKYNRKWRATIVPSGKKLYLGLFVQEEDAARAYDEAARIHYGEFARLNFPDNPP